METGIFLCVISPSHSLPAATTLNTNVLGMLFRVTRAQATDVEKGKRANCYKQ